MRGYRPNPSGGPWTCFLVAVLFLLVLPLLTLGAELLFTQQIAMASLMLMTATWPCPRRRGTWADGPSGSP